MKDNMDTKKKYCKISISCCKNNYLNHEEIKDVKKIKELNIKDNILIHCQKPLVKCINEFNQLMNHTNRLSSPRNMIIILLKSRDKRINFHFHFLSNFIFRNLIIKF